VSSRNNSLDFVLAAAFIAVLGLVVWRARSRGSEDVPVAVGTPLPALQVDGWLNVPEGEQFDPAGELLVVDCWATWCPGCVAELPKLATIVANYRPLGVKFLGATQETERDLPTIEKLIASTPGFDWPVAYGASRFVSPLDFEYIPTVILFGRDGRARWSGYGTQGLEQALDEALAEDVRAARPTAKNDPPATES
jgi:thiol-disulfide isomerase/thioredoxin